MKKSKYKLLLTTFMGTLALTLSANLTYSQLITKAYADVNSTSKLDVSLIDNNSNTSVENNLILTNNGESLDLSKVTIRYYFSNDKCNSQVFNCYDASINSSDNYKNISSSVKGKFVKLDTPMQNADSYLEISFDENAGTFNSSDVLKLKTSINNSDWSSFNSDNDYSFNDSAKAVILVDGKVIHGIEPTQKSEETTTSVNKNMKVEVSEDGQTSENSVNPTFTITNTGSCDLDLKDVNLKYYYTSDSSVNENFSCYYAGTTTGNYYSLTSYVKGTIEKLENPLETADSCLYLGFDGGILKSGQSMSVQANINKSDWSSYDKSNDYSYNNSDNIVSSIDGNIISGTSPIKNENDKIEESPKLTMGGVTGKGGETISVPINISNINKLGMNKFHLKVSYDPNIMTLDGSIGHGDILKGCPYSVFKNGRWHNSNDNTIDIDLDFTNNEDLLPMYEDGDYIILHFKLANDVESGTTSLKIVTAPTFTDASNKEYDSSSIKTENLPINLIYNPETIKNSIIYKNYFTYDKKTLSDISIPIKLYENTIKNITVFSGDLNKDLEEGKHYIVENDNLILQKDFLKSFTNKNAVIFITFSAGNSQSILINNKDFKYDVDNNNCGFTDDEANIAVASSNIFTSFADNPNYFVIKNTSNVDINLKDLNIDYYYNKPDMYTVETFKPYYASILGHNKTLQVSSIVDPYPCDYYCNEDSILKISFNDEKSILKPGETLVLNGYVDRDFSSEDCKINNDSYLLRPYNPIVVTYGNDCLFNTAPDSFARDSKITPENIELNADNIDDTSVSIKLNWNYLSSIKEYRNGSLVKKLIRGTDYIMNKRNEVILTKSFLNSIDSKYSTLNFIFNAGHSQSIEIVNHKYDSNIEEGTLRLRNSQSQIFGETGMCGGSDSVRWNDELVVPIYLTDLSNEYVSGEINLKFDKTLFKYAKIESSADSNYSVNVDLNLGIISIKILNSTKVVNTSDPLFKVIFKPTGNTQPQKINISLSDDSYYINELGEKYKPVYNYNDIRLLDIYSGNIYLSSEAATVAQGDTIIIPIYSKDSRIYNVVDYKYNFSYDTSIFEDAYITSGEICNPNGFSSDTDTEAGTISAKYDADNNSLKYIKEDGIIMNLVLKVKDDAPIGNTLLVPTNNKTYLSPAEFSYSNFSLEPITIIAKNS